LHRGVYAVGHANLSPEGQMMAAALAYGSGAVVSHESAAYLWRMSPRCPSIVHVTVAGTARRGKRAGIVLHYSRTLRSDQTTRRKNIPVTKPDRTRSDLGWDRVPTRSGLERRFLRICRVYGLPRPEANVRIGSLLVDFLWREQRLVVEVDGYRYHSDRESFRADRARDRELNRRGFVVMRFADDELDNELAVASALRARLAHRRHE
jgi:very-short-patch-repair endonuclease